MQTLTGRVQICVDSCTPLERFAFLVAALCHDLEHNGLNNAFHSNSQSSLAIRCTSGRLLARATCPKPCYAFPCLLAYLDHSADNDRSILENHHSATAFEIMLDEAIKLTSVLSPSDYKLFRKIVVESILSRPIACWHAT